MFLDPFDDDPPARRKYKVIYFGESYYVAVAWPRARTFVIGGLVILGLIYLSSCS
jgi:hypothetical protein